MRRWTVAILACALLVAGGPGRAADQNLLVNPDFDEDLGGWINTHVAEWDSSDAGGSPESGSAKLTLERIDGIRIYSCVSIDPEGSYSFGATYSIVSLEAQGSVMVQVGWYEERGCSGWIADDFLTGAETGGWTTLLSEPTEPPGPTARSAGLELNVFKNRGDGAFTAYFDDAVLIPEPSIAVGRGLTLLVLGTLRIGRRRRV